MISVIIATYGEDYWEQLAQQRALPSVEAQHNADNEIIIGHDPDGTIASVRNELASKARGDWLCFLDADDELGPNFLAVMERHARKQSNVLLTPIVQQVVRGRRRHPHFYAEVNLSSGNWLIVGTVLERELFERAQGFGDYPHGFEDFSLWSKCWRLGADVIKVRNAVYIQHVNPNSKHRQGWRDREYQISTHQRVVRELDEWGSRYGVR